MVAIIDDLIVILGGALTLISKLPKWLDYIIFLAIITVPQLFGVGGFLDGLFQLFGNAFGIDLTYGTFLILAWLSGLLIMVLTFRHSLTL